jgi:hypothetical protein
MLNIQLALPDPKSPRTKRIEVVLDSGATRCLFGFRETPGDQNGFMSHKSKRLALEESKAPTFTM